MHDVEWQKSTYSGDGSNCVHVAAMAPDTILLRESDEPEDHVLTTAPSALRQLIRSLK
ncbi:DUF397 domain-containing protein [Streptomyces griseoaurantiacus]|jgi:hypothetical protein|uniref:DUF397 domain-containing protein n=2 Tax=Streptomyces griseoaurantiacus TaxID=68213 RepID=F3NF41_9ACTN|nr:MULTISPECIES: DUF397 domain-containing protein [Streptomyces]EGG47924.1 hypothetical protein SGM_1755 [Streptomyces griseoaurantiacus M045]SDG01612.1 protein of unknown function [Streptomyces jietaisiensis]